MSKITSLKELLLEELGDLYNAENQLVKALPKMASACSSDELKSAFEEHLEQTRNQVNRLEEIFEDLGEKPTEIKCKGMKGIISEGDEAIKSASRSPVRDAALIGAAQRVEHYEIAGYGCARTYAEQLGYEDAADLLQETLEEEEETDERLTELAESTINPEAEEAGEDEEEEEVRQDEQVVR